MVVFNFISLILIISLSIIILILINENNKNNENNHRIETYGDEKAIIWNLKPKSAWIDFRVNDLIGTYWAPNPSKNAIYCRNLCENNNLCSAFIYDTQKTCRLLKTTNPKWDDNSLRSPGNPVGGQWGGGIKE